MTPANIKVMVLQGFAEEPQSAAVLREIMKQAKANIIISFVLNGEKVSATIYPTDI